MPVFEYLLRFYYHRVLVLYTHSYLVCSVNTLRLQLILHIYVLSVYFPVRERETPIEPRLTSFRKFGVKDG